MGKQKVPLKHVPVRTCVGCGAESPKGNLVRIVRRPTGSVEVDLKGKKSGRGAYICLTTSCLGLALKGKRLESVLKIKLSPEGKAALGEQIKQLLAS